MQYKYLGKTGLKVSSLCLGTMTYGNQVNKEEATNIIARALEAGINFFDTADAYADGNSEEIVGKALKKERQSVILATKVASRTGSGVNDIGLSRQHIIKGIEDSLRRLATDYIDIYYVHWPDYNTPIEETLQTLNDLVHQGKIRYIGCSNFRAWQLCKALWVSDINKLTSFTCIQPPYNLLTRDIEYELLPLCVSEGIGVCVYNPLAAGLLTGKYDPDKPPTEGTRFNIEGMGSLYRERYWSNANFQAVSNLKEIARKYDRNLIQFALAWILSNDTITSAICGTTSLNQLEENLRATELKLSEEELIECDNVWQQLRPLRFFYGR
ncbi:MAG: aldo/keto reductase [Dehalococcoidales bacterium]|nr:aldo/keto reductase [Dehalococcoidales bacterium]